jgi:hypothetical protein
MTKQYVATADHATAATGTAAQHPGQHVTATTNSARSGKADEVVHCYGFLAVDNASRVSGQVPHPRGGENVTS